jgi:hypothetical protein
MSALIFRYRSIAKTTRRMFCDCCRPWCMDEGDPVVRLYTFSCWSFWEYLYKMFTNVSMYRPNFSFRRTREFVFALLQTPIHVIFPKFENRHSINIVRIVSRALLHACGQFVYHLLAVQRFSTSHLIKRSAACFMRSYQCIIGKSRGRVY